MADPSRADADEVASDRPAAAPDDTTDVSAEGDAPTEGEGDAQREAAAPGGAPVAEHESAEPTEVISPPPSAPKPAPTPRSKLIGRPTERRYTAPSGFDAGRTEKLDATFEPATEVISVPTEPVAKPTPDQPPLLPPRTATPQSIPPRRGPRRRYRSWGWVVALILVIAALAAVAIFGTIWLTRGNTSKASPEELVRTTIDNFDIAVQKGDLATLRTITCGTTRDAYVNYDERAWADTHARVAAAKQYPVVASIDEVVVNGDHAEANVTTFMAYDPATRSTRSFDLQFRDNQWKICQASNG
jgi:hypothetical protein